ncbi:MAG: aminoglycoside phosphotransferase family protein [Bacteroidota bacterium]
MYDQHFLVAVISNFVTEKNYRFTSFGSGHIHDTYLVETRGDFPQRYLLQRINNHVFQDIPKMMENIYTITNYLKQEIEQQEDSVFTTTEVIPTINKALFFKDSDDQYWRMLTFIPETISYNKVTSEIQAFEAGFAFGKFQRFLSTMPTSDLTITIPNFHNMEYRLANFAKSKSEDVVNRLKSVKAEIEFVEDRKQKMIDFYSKIETDSFPIRVTHNDTKFNNVLLDKRTQKAVSVIDLDTVMPGTILYDFGDAVRTIINLGEEDEKNLNKITIALSYYKSFAAGYLKETSPFLTHNEIRHLVFACQYMTFIMGLRFLTDYLAGDVYYKIHHATHNLQRARAQFRLLECIEKVENEMHVIIQKLSK